MAAGRAADPFGSFVGVDRGRISRRVDAAWDWYKGLGVSPHAVRADVERFHLLPRRYAEADSLLDDPEEPIAEHEHRCERCDHRDRLRPELVEIARVEQAALPDAVELRQPRYGEKAAAERAPDPGQSVSAQRPHPPVEDLPKPDHPRYHYHAAHPPT